MKTTLPSALFLFVVATFSAINGSSRIAASDDLVDAQPKLVRISALVDGSGRFIFTRGKLHYEHKHWNAPANVVFDGEPWFHLDQSPPAWSDYSHRLDLTKASIIKRQGRDVIALESTPDGFDLYVSDSPNGGASYEITLAIPRRR